MTLLPCKCGRQATIEEVAIGGYDKQVGIPYGGYGYLVCCDCGERTEMYYLKHEALEEWNGMEREDFFPEEPQEKTL